MKASLFLLASLFLSLPALAAYPVVMLDSPYDGSRYYVPNDGLRHPSIVLLHGSEGGSEPFVDMEANILATQGYTVLVYCYFDCRRSLTEPRQTLKNVEVTKVLEVVAWLRTQPPSNGKVAVYGFSRGAELTMIVGSLAMTPANHPDALIAHSPSDVFNQAWNWSWEDAKCWICKAGIGKCAQDAPFSDFLWNPACGPDDPNLIDGTKSAWLESGAGVPSGKRIEVEKYDGPILITVGDADRVWSPDQTHRIEATLLAAGRHPEVHYFPGEGHGFHGPDETHRRELVIDFLGKMR